ncbi:MAG: MarR family winged helix-turn-helix transcriptional regulator [Nocardioides sp.]|uniref:MarR family winged helix-turn-helix transcriptional regulator n=1 Tax=Nocardioides sp. TaxID=35761 RepID=UPI003F0D31A3
MSTEPSDRVDAILAHLRERSGEQDLALAEVNIRLRRVSHWLETETRRRLGPQGIEFWEVSLLSSLIRFGGALRVGQLQDLAQVTSGAITQRIARLEGLGAVERAFAPHDRRQVEVRITDAGRDRFEQLMVAVEQVERDLYGDLDPALLSALAANLRAFSLATEGPLAED